MSDIPTGLDLDEILENAILFNDRTKTWRDAKAEAKQALTRWGLEQRIDALENVLIIKFHSVTLLSTYRYTP